MRVLLTNQWHNPPSKMGRHPGAGQQDDVQAPSPPFLHAKARESSSRAFFIPYLRYPALTEFGMELPKRGLSHQYSVI
jgi:hypothetical protein